MDEWYATFHLCVNCDMSSALPHSFLMPKRGLSLQAEICVLVKFGELMPRPKEGLLKRMLRIVEVELVCADEGTHPALLLRSGAEYHIAMQLLQSPRTKLANVTYQINWVRMAAQGREASELQVGLEPTTCMSFRKSPSSPSWTILEDSRASVGEGV